MNRTVNFFLIIQVSAIFSGIYRLEFSCILNEEKIHIQSKVETCICMHQVRFGKKVDVKNAGHVREMKILIKRAQNLKKHLLAAILSACMSVSIESEVSMLVTN